MGRKAQHQSILFRVLYHWISVWVSQGRDAVAVGTSCSIVFRISTFRDRRSCVRCCSLLVLDGLGRRLFAAGRPRSPGAARSRHSSPANPRPGGPGPGAGSTRHRRRRRSAAGAGDCSPAGDPCFQRDIDPDITSITAFSGSAGVGTHEQLAAGRARQHPCRHGLQSRSTTACRNATTRSSHSGARDRTGHAAGAGAVSDNR